MFRKCEICHNDIEGMYYASLRCKDGDGRIVEFKGDLCLNCAIEIQHRTLLTRNVLPGKATWHKDTWKQSELFVTGLEL